MAGHNIFERQPFRMLPTPSCRTTYLLEYQNGLVRMSSFRKWERTRRARNQRKVNATTIYVSFDPGVEGRSEHVKAGFLLELVVAANQLDLATKLLS